jgi:predicted CXXCH cytochrome family protein
MNATYVGGPACASCHAREAGLWRGSHHDLAIQPADSLTVLGDFRNATFRYGSVTTTFHRRGAAYVVQTDGPDGQLADFDVRYTFGVYPLQQYLLELPRGRLQALSIAWDARPASEGGQRWFHLYPREHIAHGDELHWTGPQQNWNFMCADCHSTDLKRNYDASKRSYRTTWSDIDVSCEACHGPGSAHVAWARRAGGRKARTAESMGLTVSFREHGARAWAIDPATGSARQHAGPLTAEIQTCAPCHSRRTLVAAGYRPGRPLYDYYLPALLDTTLYFPDGQQREEVYEWGSFLESRMYHAGVTCSDCHDPHSGRLRAEGNALCATCHRATVYDTPAHHHHAAGSDAARCVSCHMLARDYMGHDTRHDHSFRVPRPDQSASLGTPNACSDCHRDHPPAWAAEAIERWYGPTRQRGSSYAAALAAGRAVAANGGSALDAVVDDPAAPAIARASALELMAPYLSPDDVPRVEQALRSPDPLVRAAALGLLPAWDPSRRWQVAAPLLEDPVRSVRFAAVDALAGSPPPSEAQRAAFVRAAAEYRAAQMFNADRAESWLNLGVLDTRLGDHGSGALFCATQCRIGCATEFARPISERIWRPDRMRDAATAWRRSAHCGMVR